MKDVLKPVLTWLIIVALTVAGLVIAKQQGWLSQLSEALK